ncbi:MAG: phosphoribosylanthranilate isomerase [Gammaproteobacteria bacterium]|nr:phosphoribosylanthranilate isomerase [Gammaproteobacteria bacterium]
MKKTHTPPRIKVCGFTTEQDARNAIDMGVDALGFVFYEKSKRYVTPESLQWMKTLPSFTQMVALFVNPSRNYVEQILKQLPIDIIQFHGDESAIFCEQFHYRYIKAVPMEGLKQQQATDYMNTHQNASAFLLDNYGGNKIGGSGTAFDWSNIPTNSDHALIMAGGLNSDNVGVVIHHCHPYGVDVSSGVESAAGIKSVEKMSEFIAAVKATN